MIECVTEAIVLEWTPTGEADARVHLFTEAWGRGVARATSIRKITSKLSSHLQPMNIVRTRLVEQNGIQLVDALTGRKNLHDPKLVIPLQLIKALTGEGERDWELWQFLKLGLSGKLIIDTRSVLARLGFDPQFATCAFCNKTPVRVFSLEDLHFYCAGCSAGHQASFIYVEN